MYTCMAFCLELDIILFLQQIWVILFSLQQLHYNYSMKCCAIDRISRRCFPEISRPSNNCNYLKFSIDFATPLTSLSWNTRLCI